MNISSLIKDNIGRDYVSESTDCINKVMYCLRNVVHTSGKHLNSLDQCCPTFLCTRAQFTDAYGGGGATTLLLLLLLLDTTISTTS
jgi:hypothetical protein